MVPIAEERLLRPVGKVREVPRSVDTPDVVFFRAASRSPPIPIADSSGSRKGSQVDRNGFLRVRAQGAASEEIAPTASCKSLYSSL